MLDFTETGSPRRLVVVAAHPGDTTFGAGGLVATAHASGVSVYVVLLTAGRSLTGPVDPSLALAHVAAVEGAVDLLAPGAPVAYLGATPGTLHQRVEEIEAGLLPLVLGGRQTLVAAPWRRDGDPDHETTGRAAAAVATSAGARLVEFPVSAWRTRQHPWPTLERLALVPETQFRKQQAADRLRGIDRCQPPPSRALANAEHFVVEAVVPVDG
ncbi:PIG-L deacetylase family protein [Nocardioides sp. GCM10027113]|uniref:PIG-L deacetylase family protein n=1 Tax=unclassified Nocardioides TaxID=2615069 RepID=UPI00360B36FF